MSGVISDFGAVFARWRTWFLMANQDIMMRYRRSLIGPFWISISMSLTIIGMSFVFGNVFERSFQEYLFYLAAGFLVWNFIAGSMNDGCGVLVEAESHLRAVPLPAPVLVARMIQRNLVIFFHNALVVGGVMVVFGFRPSMALFYAAPGMALLTAYAFFFALVVSPICLRFRDLTQVVGSVLQLAFFLTPIIWMPDQGRLPPVIVHANPFYHLLELVRAPIQGHPPELINWYVALGLVWGLVGLSLVTLSATRKRIFTWL
ncbi:MAG: ABC transporter permease [Alphaproteobacteria bacterium]|nr:ABC transporter permease [Alphaproteobacteria bacterium]